ERTNRGTDNSGLFITASLSSRYNIGSNKEPSTMNAAAFRHFYNYHFAENRKIWDEYITPLSQEQFTQNNGYSRGSVRNQIVHIMNTDQSWFGDLPDVERVPDLTPADSDDLNIIRAHWDKVEQNMRAYLAKLQD